MQPIDWIRVRRPDEAARALNFGRHGEWLIAAISPGCDRASGTATADTLAEFLAQPAETLVVLDPVFTMLGPAALAMSLNEALCRPGLLTLLVPPGDTPPVTGVNHGPVRSFVGPAALLRSAGIAALDPEPETLCYRALWSVIHGAGVRVLARECAPKPDELPLWSPNSGPRLPSTALIMAHRGPPEFLAAALGGITACDPRPDVVRVGLDVQSDELEAYHAIAAAHSDVEFYAGSDAPVGPYVIRQALASITRERFIVFHDSDDHSTCDRFHWLHAEMARAAPGLVGSHELRYDEDDREVRAVRFPLDVTAALAVEPKHPQLHPTTLVATDHYRNAGGFSTDCIFGNDTQLMLRAYFHGPLRNVNRFLYIRRDRWESLTNAKETGMENPLRIARNLAWWSDFEAVKAGRMRLEDSRLMAIEGAKGWKLALFHPPARQGS
jgi:hypothetical protein